MKNVERLILLFTIFAMAYFAVAKCVYAQQADEKQSFRLAPVVVKAEKRIEEAQDVPASITVLEEGDLKDMGIKSTDDLARHVPGLEFVDFGSRRHVLMFLRGIKSLPNGEPSTGYYVDGVNYSKPYMFNFPLFDVEHIEVLKGPQGTLYGRNTSGGVINVYTKQPGNDVSASVGTTFGNYNQKESRGYWSGPLVEDKLFLGIYGMAAYRDGYMVNDVDTGNKDGRYLDGKSGRIKLRYLANDDWEISMTMDAQQHDDGAYTARRTERNGLVKAGRADVDKRYHYSHDYESTQKNACWGTTLISKYETGAGALHSITGYRAYHSDEYIDTDFSPLDVMRKEYVQKDSDFTQEFRMVSPEDKGPFRWLMGTYFFHLRADTETANLFGVDSANPGLKVDFDTERKNVGASLFGQGTYTMFDKLDLTLGLRGEYERASIESSQFNTPAGGPSSLTASMDGSKEFTAFLPKVVLAWHFNDDHMTYGTISRAHRSGGFNDVSAPAGSEVYGEEYSWLYEIGQKSFFLNQRLMFNVAGFHTEIQEEQLPLFKVASMQSYTANAGKSHRTGIEIESRYKLTSDLGLSANLSWLRAEYDEYYDPVIAQDYKGNRVFCVPNYTYGIALDYRRQLSEGWSLFSRADLMGVGSRYFDDANTVKEDPYELVDLRLGVEGEHLDCSLWVKNLFDKEYVAFENTKTGAAEDGAPRMFGVSLDYRF